MSRIALAEMVEELRSELREAVEQGKGRDLNFEVQEITLEAQVQVTKEAEGKVGFWVFTEVKGKAARADVHKVVVKLKPIGPDGKVDQGRAVRGRSWNTDALCESPTATSLAEEERAI